MLPKFICVGCAKDLETAYRFKIQCELTDRKFRERIEQVVNSKSILKLEIDQSAAAEYFDVERLIESDHEAETNVDMREVDDSHSEVFFLDESSDMEATDNELSNDEMAEPVTDDMSLCAEEAGRSPPNNGDEEMKDALRQQRSAKAGKKSFMCATCNTAFDSKAVLNVHVKAHGTNRYPCPICGKWFKRRYHMVSHTLIHKGLTKSFACKLCDKSYTSQTNLDRHIRVTHRNEKKYKCDECDKCFSQLTILRIHRAVHTSERNFPCNLCDKKFKAKEHLRSHQLRHLPKSEQPQRKYSSPRKKYKPKLKTCVCAICGKQSTTNALHMSHMK